MAGSSREAIIVEPPSASAALISRSTRQTLKTTKHQTSSNSTEQSAVAGSSREGAIPKEKKKMPSDNVCHPKGYQIEKDEKQRSARRQRR